MTSDDAWFVYHRRPGKISAVPTGWRGWAALVGFVVAMTGVAALVVPLVARPVSPIAVAPLMLVLTGGGIVGFFRWVVLPRGRRVDTP